MGHLGVLDRSAAPPCPFGMLVRSNLGARCVYPPAAHAPQLRALRLAALLPHALTLSSWVCRYLDLHAGDSVSIVSYTVTNTASTAGVGAAAGAAAGDTSMTMRTTTMSTPHAIFTGRVLPSKPVSGVIPLCCYQEVHISLQLSQVGSLATTGATRAAGALPRYGFFITFSVEAMPSPPPPPAAPPISTPMQPASSDTPPEVCEGVLLMHDGLQSSPASGYVTSDLRWRLWADGTDPWADGSRAAWRRPDLPYTSNPDYGDPGQWLMSYSRGSRCSWEFRLDVGTAVDFSVRWEETRALCSCAAVTIGACARVDRPHLCCVYVAHADCDTEPFALLALQQRYKHVVGRHEHAHALRMTRVAQCT